MKSRKHRYPSTSTTVSALRVSAVAAVVRRWMRATSRSRTPTGINRSRRPVSPLDADPGVSLDPAARSNASVAALLKQLLAALARQPRGGELPGIVGKAIAAGTAAGEEQFAVAVAAGQQLNPADVGAVFEAVSRELNVDLNVVERQALHDDWSRYIVGRRTATWLDRNENSQLADDSAAWMIGWLFEQGKFDPLTVTIVTPHLPTVGRRWRLFPNSRRSCRRAESAAEPR